MPFVDVVARGGGPLNQIREPVVSNRFVVVLILEVVPGFLEAVLVHGSQELSLAGRLGTHPVGHGCRHNSLESHLGVVGKFKVGGLHRTALMRLVKAAFLQHDKDPIYVQLVALLHKLFYTVHWSFLLSLISTFHLLY